MQNLFFGDIGFQFLQRQFLLQVHLVQQNDSLFILDKGQNFLIFLLQRTGAIQHHDNKVSFFRISLGFFHTHAFHHIACFTDASRIHDFDGDAVNIQILFYSIPRCTGNIRNNSAVFFQEPVQQGRFANVRLADNNRLQTFTDNLASIRTFQQLFHFFQQFGRTFFHVAVGFVFNIIVRIINDRFNRRDHIQNFITHFANCRFQSAFQLIHRRLTAEFCFRFDQVNDRFRLGQVDTTIQEASFCEFTGFRNAGACFQHCLQYPSCYQRTTMAVDLYDIFFGVGMGCFHDGNQNLVDNLAVQIGDFTIRHCMCRFFSQFFLADEDLVRDFDTACAGHSYNADAANTHRRGNCRNHII